MQMAMIPLHAEAFGEVVTSLNEAMALLGSVPHEVELISGIVDDLAEQLAQPPPPEPEVCVPTRVSI